MEGGDPYYEDFYNLRTNNGTSMKGMFYYYDAPELNLSSIDVSNVTNMNRMFDHCSSSVNIDGWDTSKVTDMNNMFYYFSGSIDVSKLDTSSAKDVQSMFSYVNTDNIILTGFSFPKTTNLSRIFDSATGTTLDLSSWDISNITSMGYMFNSAKIKRIDLTGWNTSKVTDMYNMFNTYNNPLEELIIPDWDMTNVTSSNSTGFMKDSYMSNLKLLDLSRSNDTTITKIASFLPTRATTTFGTVLVPENTSQEAYDALVAKYWRPIGAAISPVPTNCSIVAELDEIMPGKSTKVFIGAYEPWNADPSKVELVLVSDSSIATITEDNEVISTGVLGDIILEVRIKDTQEVISTKIIPVTETDSYPNLVKFRVASAPSSTGTIVTVNGSKKKLSDLTYDSITDIYSYDAGVPITSIKFSRDGNMSELIKLNTSNVTSMYQMFYGCNLLTQLNVSNFNTSEVINMQNMFAYCYKLTSLDLSNFDTSNVTYIDSMLEGCNSLHTLRLDNCSNDTISKIITSVGFPTNAIDGVTRTIYCKEENAAGLTPPTNWVFSYVTEEEPEVPVDPPAGDIPLYVPGEFRSNTELTEVRTMVTSEHDNLDSMFAMCENLVSVNTQDWDTSNVYEMYYMFAHCKSLTTLNLSNWVTDKVTRMAEMFMLCWNLTELDLSNFNTSNVTSVSYMFYNCQRLESLDLSNFNLENLTGDANNPMGTENMLDSCYALTTLRLDNCSYDTISKIINESGIPQEQAYIDGEYVTRKIYCKASEIGDLVAPNGWEFVTVE